MPFHVASLIGVFLQLKVYRYLKTFIIMSAKIDLKHIGWEDLEFIKCNVYEHDHEDSDYKSGKENFIDITGSSTVNNKYGAEFRVTLDISTAIRFAKTLRTKINEAKEVGNE